MNEKDEAGRLIEPEALRLADGLEGKHSIGYQPYAAAELRRQHAEIDRLRDELRQSSIDHTRAEVERLREEVRVLRLYGNKDCTAMADEAMKKAALRQEDKT